MRRLVRLGSRVHSERQESRLSSIRTQTTDGSGAAFEIMGHRSEKGGPRYEPNQKVPHFPPEPRPTSAGMTTPFRLESASAILLPSISG
jgi:hypothetical protein